MSLKLLKAGDPAPSMILVGDPANGTMFLVTNHTAKTAVAFISGIEVKVGSNWVTQSKLVPAQPLRLSTPEAVVAPGSTNKNTPMEEALELKPHGVCYTTIRFTGPPSPAGYGVNFVKGGPSGGPWRLCLNVQEKLTGISDVTARMRNFPEMQSRATNAPMNPFSEKYSYFGPATKVYSEEIP